MVQITCKLKNSSHIFELHRQEPLKDLRAKVASKFDIPKDETAIMFGGKFLEDGKTLWDYKVNHGSVLLILQRKAQNKQQTQDVPKALSTSASSQASSQPEVPQLNVNASSSSYSNRRFICKLDNIDEETKGVPHTMERRMKSLFKIDLSLLDKNETTPMEIEKHVGSIEKKSLEAQDEEELGEDEFFVEAILAERKKKGQKEYLVKWKEYTDDWNTWEPEQNVQETEALEKFLQEKLAQNGGSNNIKEEQKKEENKESSSNYKIVFDYGRFDLPTDKETMQRYALLQLTAVDDGKQEFLSVTTETNPTHEGTHSIVFEIDPSETPFPTQIVYLTLGMLKADEYSCVKCNESTDLEKMLVCDTCGVTYHIHCLDPPLAEVPKEIWYCSTCFAKPKKKKSTKKPAPSELTTKQWGGGMACAGRTKSCTIVDSDYIGKIPGVDVGSWWKHRLHCSEDGVHRPPVAGIAGGPKKGAPSIVVSGGYEDDNDKGEVFIYTGAGGRDLSGNKRTSKQSCDQELTRVNLALAAMCYGKKVTCKKCNPLVQCDDCLKNWRLGKPVRVVRSSKKDKYVSKHHVPDGGYRYDGLYKVVDFWPEIGQSGFVVYRYLLKRDDPEPAPWTPEGKEKADKLHKEGLKRATANANGESKDEEPKPKEETAPKTPTKRKVEDKAESRTSPTGKKMKQMTLFGFGKTSTPTKEDSKENAKISSANTESEVLTKEQKTLIQNDKLNIDTWNKLLQAVDVKEITSKKKFLEGVESKFQCSVCLERCTEPVTNPCSHNFCLTCIKYGMEKNENKCPCCRKDMPQIPKVNQALVSVLRSLFGTN